VNPYTGQTTPLNLEPGGDFHSELERAAKDVECAVEDLVLVTGKEEHIRNTSAAVAAYNAKRKERTRARARAKNKVARKQRKANRK